MKIIGAIIFIIGLVDLGLSFTGVNMTAFLGDELSMFSAYAFLALGGYLYNKGGASEEEEEESWFIKSLIPKGHTTLRIAECQQCEKSNKHFCLIGFFFVFRYTKAASIGNCISERDNKKNTILTYELIFRETGTLAQRRAAQKKPFKY